jgi:hypothetical protein
VIFGCLLFCLSPLLAHGEETSHTKAPSTSKIIFKEDAESTETTVPEARSSSFLFPSEDSTTDVSHLDEDDGVVGRSRRTSKFLRPAAELIAKKLSNKRPTKEEILAHIDEVNNNLPDDRVKWPGDSPGGSRRGKKLNLDFSLFGIKRSIVGVLN